MDHPLTQDPDGPVSFAYTWVDTLAKYWHMLTFQQRRDYAKMMEDGLPPPPLIEIKDMVLLERGVTTPRLGFTIRKYRKRRGFRQKEFARQLGISPALLCFYEHGDREPKLDMLNRIVRLLRIPPEEVMAIDPQASVKRIEDTTLVKN